MVRLKYSVSFLLLTACLGASAQDSDSAASTTPASTASTGTSTSAPSATTLKDISLTQAMEGRRNFVDFNVGVNGVYDSGGAATGEQGPGFVGNWGVLANHLFRNGSMALNYYGDYRYFQSGSFGKGTDQDLSFITSKGLGRHWTITASLSGGIFLSGASYFVIVPTQTNQVQLNPNASSNKFLSMNVAMSYQQTKRLSYQVGANYFLSRYDSNAASGVGIPFGTEGFGGLGSVQYRLTRRTTLSGNYSYTYYTYEGEGGNSGVNTIYGALSHEFASHWKIGGSAGYSIINTRQTLTIPINEINIAPPETVLVGQHNQTTHFPYFQGFASKFWRRTSFSVQGGQSVTPGNGQTLTSRALGASAIYAYTMRGSSFGVTAGYNYFKSVLTPNATQSLNYNIGSFGASYGRTLRRFFSVNLRYDYLNYGGVYGYNDNRVTVGFAWHSQNIPITLF